MRPQLHPYSLDSRYTWIPRLVWLGLALALVFGLALEWSPWKPPAWLDTPATLGFYGLLFAIVDRWGANVPEVRRLLGIPGFAGKYDVIAKSSYDDFTKEYKGTAEITQTWSRICVHMRFEASESTSVAAHALEVATGGGYELSYEYHNQPKAGADPKLQNHGGTAWLRLSADGQDLHGEYFTGRNRKTHGTLTLTRQL